MSEDTGESANALSTHAMRNWLATILANIEYAERIVEDVTGASDAVLPADLKEALAHAHRAALSLREHLDAAHTSKQR